MYFPMAVWIWILCMFVLHWLLSCASCFVFALVDRFGNIWLSPAAGSMVATEVTRFSCTSRSTPGPWFCDFDCAFAHIRICVHPWPCMCFGHILHPLPSDFGKQHMFLCSLLDSVLAQQQLISLATWFWKMQSAIVFSTCLIIVSSIWLG